MEVLASQVQHSYSNQPNVVSIRLEHNTHAWRPLAYSKKEKVVIASHVAYFALFEWLRRKSESSSKCIFDLAHGYQSCHLSDKFFGWFSRIWCIDRGRTCEGRVNRAQTVSAWIVSLIWGKRTAAKCKMIIKQVSKHILTSFDRISLIMMNRSKQCRSATDREEVGVNHKS